MQQALAENVIQLAVAARYEVTTTSSNIGLMKYYRASQVFDYHSTTVATDIVHAFRYKATSGALSPWAQEPSRCISTIMNKCHGDKFITMATYPLPDLPPETFVLPRTVIHFISKKIEYFIKPKLKWIRLRNIFGSTLVWNGIGKAIYVNLLPAALEGGSYIWAPESEVVKRRLPFISHGLEIKKKG